MDVINIPPRINRRSSFGINGRDRIPPAYPLSWQKFAGQGDCFCAAGIDFLPAGWYNNGRKPYTRQGRQNGFTRPWARSARRQAWEKRKERDRDDERVSKKETRAFLCRRLCGFAGDGGFVFGCGECPVCIRERRTDRFAGSFRAAAGCRFPLVGRGRDGTIPVSSGIGAGFAGTQAAGRTGADISGVYFALSADLDCSSLSGWDGIGTVDASHPENSRAFGGILDGRYQGKQYVIRNLTGTTAYLLISSNVGNCAVSYWKTAGSRLRFPSRARG